MHGCKNVPSTTGLCEIKARAPFPHSAMLSAGRLHNGAEKKAPGKKTRFFLFNIALWGKGGAGFYFAQTGLTKNGFLAFYNTFDFSGLAPRTHHGFRFPFLLFGPRGGWRGLLPVNPFTFSFPFGRSEWGGGGWTGANVRFHFLPRSYRTCPAQPFCHLPLCACMYVQTI